LLGPDETKWELETWVYGFYKVYCKHDDEKPYSAIWLPATSHASTLAEGARLNDYVLILYSLGNVMAWVLSFVGRLMTDLSECKVGKEVLASCGNSWTEWILHKYPGVCHHCGEKPCICASVRDCVELRHDTKKVEYDAFSKKRNARIEEEYRKFLLSEKAHEKLSMPELFDVFNDIYGGTLWGVPLPDIAFHFLEEIGEVSKAIANLEVLVGRNSRTEWKTKVGNGEGMDWQKYSLACTSLTRELADVFSWTTALCYKIAQLRKQAGCPQTWNPRETLSQLYTGRIPEGRTRKSVEISLTTYKFICRYCGEEACKDTCVREEIARRLLEDSEELEKRYRYEIPIT